MVYFRDGNRRVLCNESKRVCLREGHTVSKFDAEVEKEYRAARVCKSFAEVSLSYQLSNE